MGKIAAIQMTSTELVSDNLKNAAVLIQEAAKKGAQLIILPEMFPLVGSAEAKIKISEPFGNGPIQNFLAEQAKKNHTWIIGGTIPIKEKNEAKAKAASLVFNAQGNFVARYDKIHLFDVIISDTESYQESENLAPGNELAIVETPLGKVGLAVCYDIRFPEMFRKLFHSGAEILAIPAAFTMKTGKAHWEVLMRSRAIENFCFVIGACQTGTHPSGRKTYGHSLIIDPWGEVLQKLDTEVGVITADIDLQKLRQIREHMAAGR